MYGSCGAEEGGRVHQPPWPPPTPRSSVASPAFARTSPGAAAKSAKSDLGWGLVELESRARDGAWRQLLQLLGRAVQLLRWGVAALAARAAQPLDNNYVREPVPCASCGVSEAYPFAAISALAGWQRPASHVIVAAWRALRIVEQAL